MKKDYITRELIKIIATTSLNSKLPTINEMTEKLSCSRGIIQNILIGLEQADVITLSKGNHGTTLVATDKQKLIDILFDNKIHLHIPPNVNYSLIIDPLLTGLNSLFEKRDLIVYYSFNHSTRDNIKLLTLDQIDCTLVSKRYFDQFLSTDYQLLYTLNSADSAITILGETLPENYYLNTTIPVTAENELVVICKPYIYNLIIAD